MNKKRYKQELYNLQVELVKFQKHIIKTDLKVCVVFEGRDTAGKDGTIKRFTQHLSPREARVVALGKPSDKDQKSWYFQRYVPFLPSGGEIVFFNRSWYNRAGVEIVMGFCSMPEYKDFLEEVGHFEKLLNHSGILFIKYYLDISKDEQAKRLKDRLTNPLKQWKISPIDMKAQEYWEQYSTARNQMFNKTSFDFAPWHIIKADDKKSARINTIKHFLSNMDYPEKDQSILDFDEKIICKFSQECYKNKFISK